MAASLTARWRRHCVSSRMWILHREYRNCKFTRTTEGMLLYTPSVLVSKSCFYSSFADMLRTALPKLTRFKPEVLECDGLPQFLTGRSIKWSRSLVDKETPHRASFHRITRSLHHNNLRLSKPWLTRISLRTYILLHFPRICISNMVAIPNASIDFYRRYVRVSRNLDLTRCLGNAQAWGDPWLLPWSQTAQPAHLIWSSVLRRTRLIKTA